MAERAGKWASTGDDLGRMMSGHEDRYREHRAGRPRSSLDRMLGQSATSEAAIRAMAAKAWRLHRIMLFTPADLARMPDFARATIEGEARRAYGAREG